MKHAPRTIGFLQAVGIAAYIALFASLAYRVRLLVETGAIHVHPIAGVMLFLLAFVISALVAGSIALAYPATLFFNGRRAEALKTVFWSAAWLVVMFAVAAAAALTVGFGAL